MLTQIPAQSQPLESALPPPPAPSTPFLIQGFIIDAIRGVDKALFTRRVSMVESPRLCGDAALRKTWILSFGPWACDFLPLLSGALPRKGQVLYHRLNVNVIMHALGPPVLRERWQIPAQHTALSPPLASELVSDGHILYLAVAKDLVHLSHSARFPLL